MFEFEIYCLIGRDSYGVDTVVAEGFEAQGGMITFYNKDEAAIAVYNAGMVAKIKRMDGGRTGGRKRPRPKSSLWVQER